MNSYTNEVAHLLDINSKEITERLAEGMSLNKVKEFTKTNILPLSFPTDEGRTVKETYLLRTREEDASIIRAYVEKQLTILFLQRRAKLFDAVAEEIRDNNHPAPRSAATMLIRTISDEMNIEFFDTLSIYDYDTYNNYDNLDKWAREAVFESAWEQEFGQLESVRYENGADHE